jgi:hypothetical protein
MPLPFDGQVLLRAYLMYSLRKSRKSSISCCINALLADAVDHLMNPRSNGSILYDFTGKRKGCSVEKSPGRTFSPEILEQRRGGLVAPRRPPPTAEKRILSVKAFPFTPMRRMDLDASLSIRIQPFAEGAATGKTRACISPPSITANSRSRSSGAVHIGFHIR